MESYNNIRLDQVPLNKKIKGRRNKALSIHDSLVLENYISVTVPHARHKLYPWLNKYIIIKVTVIIHKSTRKITVKN